MLDNVHLLKTIDTIILNQSLKILKYEVQFVKIFTVYLHVI